jgi:hypothetical protein
MPRKMCLSQCALALRLPGGAPPSAAAPLVALSATSARSGVSVGVHATCARDATGQSGGDSATAQAVPPATADALAHAAAAAAVPFTLSLAAAGETGSVGSATGGAVARARGGAAALTLAALAMSTGAARLGGCAPELHRHKALLVALADADVALALDADSNPAATSSTPISDDLAAAMQAAGVAVVVAAPDGASAAARLGRMPRHVAHKALRAVPAAALLRAAPRAALAARLARLLGPDVPADAPATRPRLQTPPSEVLRPRAPPPTPPPRPPSPREAPPAAPPAPPLSVSSGVMRPMVRASPAVVAEKAAVLAAPGASRRSPSPSPSPARRRGSRGSSPAAAQSQSPPQHQNNDVIASVSADVAASEEVPTGPGPWPLHLAAARGAPVDIVALLCESRPGEAAAPDGAGRTPLHFAAGAGAQPPLMRAWLAAAPAAATSRDARGWAPLHCAAAVGGRCGVESLRMLLAAAPAAAGWADSAGRTPAALAAAAGWSAGAELLQSAATEHAQARAAAATAAALSRSPAPSPRGGSGGGGGAWSPPPPSVASSSDSYDDPSRRVQAGLAQQRAVEWRSAAAGAGSPVPSVPGTPRGSSDGGGWVTPGARSASYYGQDAPPPSPAPYPASEAAHGSDDVALGDGAELDNDAIREAHENAHSVLRWLQEAHARGLPDSDPAPAALVARLLGSLAHAEALQSERGGGHVSSGADVAAAAALRAAAPEAARYACLAELLRRATRADPALPWRAAPQAVQAGVHAPRPPSPSLWQRLRGGSGDNASPCALDVAVPACREAMLREALLCGRYAVHPSATPLISAVSGGVWLRAVDAAVPGAPRVALLLARSADRFRRERCVRAAAARASGAAAASAAVVRLLRSHDGAGAPETRGDAGADAAAAEALFSAPCSVTFGEELAARGLEAFPFLLVFEEASASLAQLMAAQAAEAAAAAVAAAQLRAGSMRLPAPMLRLRQRAPRTAWGAVRSLGWRLALGLHALHEAGLAHGALCPSHVLLLPPLETYNAESDDSGDGIGAPSPLHRWVLCDLGATVALRGIPVNGGAELLTTASACAACYLPPEAVLLPDCDDVALPGAPALKLVPRGAAAAWEGGSLRASVAADGWALGAILYEAATSSPLLPPGPPGLAALAAWDAPALETACATVRAAAHPGDAPEAEAAAALAQLLRRLLAPSPAARASSMRDVLAHRFLNATGGAVPERPADIAAATPPLCPPAADAWAPPGGGGGMLLGVAANSAAGRSSPADATMRPGSAAGGSSRAASPAAAALPPLPRRSPSPSPAAW